MSNEFKDRPKLWKDYRKGNDVESLKLSFKNHITYTLGKNEYNATLHDKYLSLAYCIKDRIVERWTLTQQEYYKRDSKRVYYFSMEFLIGRSLINNIINLGLYDTCNEALKEYNITVAELENLEEDAGLGNGGLGRLAACYLDSMATLQIPGLGYGIKYEFGIFKQRIVNGFQIEQPDNWLKFGNAWEIERPEYTYPIKFYGKVISHEENGKWKFKWIDTKDVLAVAFDYPIVGYQNKSVNSLRLWGAKASDEFNMDIFNSGDYLKACAEKNLSENISKVLYPNDNFYEGKELRLKQEYFMVSASLQDIFRRYKRTHDNLDNLENKIQIQMNDTHPALVVPELMRLLMDEEHYEWKEAWNKTKKICSYTNHTVLVEALEKWPVGLFANLLPRHMDIIYEINRRFIEELKVKYPNDIDKLRRMSIIEPSSENQIRMAYLCVVGSKKVNGVAAIHSEILKNELFKDFNEFYEGKFINVTNGITQRRWLLVSNPELANLITEKIGDKWITHLTELKKLEKYADDDDFIKRFMQIKKKNKEELADYIKRVHKIDVDPNSIFDVQVKRIHEYKRQLLNALHIIHIYNKLKEDKNFYDNFHPMTFIFGGKAAPGYYRAKMIIKLITSIGKVVNNDPLVKDKLKVVFIENYRVSLAEKIIPAADVSEQISTAGKEASGTGNMKFALNGAVTIGTLDGANIEMLEEIGNEYMYIFGKNAEEIKEIRNFNLHNPKSFYAKSKELHQILNQLETGYFVNNNKELLHVLFASLMHGVDGNPPDEYFLLIDFNSYMKTHERLNSDYKDTKKWAKSAIMNVARIGKFSSDRSIQEYCDNIWEIKPEHID